MNCVALTLNAVVITSQPVRINKCLLILSGKHLSESKHLMSFGDTVTDRRRLRFPAVNCLVFDAGPRHYTGLVAHCKLQCIMHLAYRRCCVVHVFRITKAQVTILARAQELGKPR